MAILFEDGRAGGWFDWGPLYSDRMRVQVLYFGVLKELAGGTAMEMELREGASVGELLEQAGAGAEGVRDALRTAAVAVNREYARAETVLREGDEVALLPPVSGGL